MIFVIVYCTAIDLMLPGTYKQSKSNRCNIKCVETAKIRVKNDLQNRYSKKRHYKNHFVYKCNFYFLFKLIHVFSDHEIFFDSFFFWEFSHCHDCMATYAVSVYQCWCCEFESCSGQGVQHYVIKFVSDLGAGRWYSLGTLVSSTNKTDHHNITEILLKVALNSIKPQQTILLIAT